MRRRLVLPALLLAAACDRALELAPAPVTPREEPRPRLLGDRSGSYQAFGTVTDAAGAQSFTPIGPRVTAIHVEDPAGGPLDLLVLQLRPFRFEEEPPRPDGLVVETCTEAEELPLADLASGFYSPESGEYGYELSLGSMTSRTEELEGAAQSLAGGGFLLSVPLCGEEGAREFVALQPVCPLQTSLSGLYASTPPSPDRDVAVAIDGTALFFVEWPSGGLEGLGRSGAFGFGQFDPITEQGAFLRADFRADAPPGGSCGVAGFARAGDENELSLQAWSLESGACEAVFGGVEPRPTPDDAFRGTRLRSAADVACGAPTSLPLETRAFVRTCGGRRVLDLFARLEGAELPIVADYPGISGRAAPTDAEVGADGLVVYVQLGGAGANLRRMAADAAWPPVTARFELPATAGRVFFQTHAVNLFTGLYGSTFPACPLVEGR